MTHIKKKIDPKHLYSLYYELILINELAICVRTVSALEG